MMIRVVMIACTIQTTVTKVAIKTSGIMMIAITTPETIIAMTVAVAVAVAAVAITVIAVEISIQPEVVQLAETLSQPTRLILHLDLRLHTQLLL